MPGKTNTNKITSDTKTTAPKRIRTKKSKEEISEIEPKEPEMQESANATPLLSILKKPQVIVLVIAVLLIGFAYYFKSLFVAALVNGQPISRISLVKELEKQSGKQTLDTLVTKSLILQEAKKQNVTVTDKEINDEIKKIEDSLKKRGQNLDQLLAFQGTTRTQFVEQIKIQKMVQKLIGKDIKVTDKEVNDYFEKNKETIPQDANPDEIKSSIRQQLEQQKLSEKFQSWVEDLKKKAKVNYFVNY